jgi:hypothetical protein
VKKAVKQLGPKASPGEVSALGAWTALVPILVAFGIDPTKAMAIAGGVSALAPYVVKVVIQWRGRRA